MKKYLFSIMTLFAMSAMSLFAQNPFQKVTVAQGEIEGLVKEGYVLFPAIPYAEAPVGNLRWKAPVPKAPWAGVYKAEEFAKKPWQAGAKPEECSEDCLYLSVQTPAKSKSDRLPVFVNIHGGGFSTGSYAGTQDSFVKEGIVYVSIEYRLGSLGFMAHPELAKESPSGLSGNYGILDQICALEWVHNNIDKFGGDPQTVTICGESAGGISVSILCASPMCKGFFQRGISESGSSFWPVADDRGGNTAMVNAKAAEKSGLAFQQRLGKKNLKALRKMEPSEIVNNEGGMGSFWPVVDGIAIIDDQYKLYESGNYNDVDVIVGTNSDEGWLFTRELPVGAYEQEIRATYGEWADKLLALYPATTANEAHHAVADIFRDGSFAWGTWAWARLQSQTGKKNVFMYYFDHNSPNFMPTERGANHVTEMPYIYGWQMPRTKMEEYFGYVMSRYWINFTKTGDPNGEGLPYWPQFKDGEETIMNIHNGFHLTNVPNQKQLNFFEEYFKAKR